MMQLIVLGRIPGTHFQITFIWAVLFGMAVILISIYWLDKPLLRKAAGYCLKYLAKIKFPSSTRSA